MTQNNDLDRIGWLLATIIMVSIALVVLFVQRFVSQIFDTTVEIAVFYIPAVVLVVLCLWKWTRKSPR